MATNFPTSLDTFTNPVSTDTLDKVTVPHASQHDNLNDAVAALEAKVGIDGSAVTSSLDYKVAHLTSGATGLWSPTAQGLYAATADVAYCNQASSFMSIGIPYYTGIQLQAAAPAVTKIYLHCTNGNTALHYACIYTASGNLLVQSAGVVPSTNTLTTFTVASTALAAGNYMIMVYPTSAGGNAAGFMRANAGSVPAATLNVGMSSPFLRAGTGPQTGLTTTAPSTTGTLTPTLNMHWAAIGP